MKIFAQASIAVVAILSAMDFAAALATGGSNAMNVGLAKRHCPPPSCPCDGSLAPSLFCGNETVDPRCTHGHIFQCFSNGQTCDSGPKFSCTTCGKPSCP
ncbi:hypothetical protein BD410DRAFT_651956 [Rickenella mellea]|uniref:Uncharacterized protein n=1 Tax=Rickenella mellea TaxID=50990 RepID=A0A4Y7PLQ0_9AGAM|nr:hypothetical protein BD410DRAFT_651956 [Rickenella mellea]